MRALTPTWTHYRALGPTTGFTMAVTSRSVVKKLPDAIHVVLQREWNAYLAGSSMAQHAVKEEGCKGVV